MKNKIFQILPFILLLITSSCATMIRSRSGDGRSGINIITSSTDLPIVTVNKNDHQLNSKLVFDGGQYNSTYKVIKYYLPRMYKHASLNIKTDDQIQTVNIIREKQKGWFWIEGLVPWIYEKMAGKLFYYNDVNLTKDGKKQLTKN